jgi:hypothetical protein
MIINPPRDLKPLKGKKNPASLEAGFLKIGRWV